LNLSINFLSMDKKSSITSSAISAGSELSPSSLTSPSRGFNTIRKNPLRSPFLFKLLKKSIILLLTLGQNKELIKLWKEAGLSAEKLKNIQDLNGIVDLLIEEEILERFLFIILNGPKEEIDWDAIPNSVLFEVISDFLALNGRWIEKLKNFLNDFLSGERTK